MCLCVCVLEVEVLSNLIGDGMNGEEMKGGGDGVRKGSGGDNESST